MTNPSRILSDFYANRAAAKQALNEMKRMISDWKAYNEEAFNRLARASAPNRETEFNWDTMTVRPERATQIRP